MVRQARSSIVPRLYTALLLAAGTFTAPLEAQVSFGHPLDGLSSAEFWTVYDVLRASGRLDSTSRYVSVDLREPAKDAVLAWSPGQPMRREAMAIIKHGRGVAEAVVDVAGKKLVSFNVVKGAQAPFLFSEDDETGELIKADPRVRAALARRGITDLALVQCGSGPAGYYDLPEQRGRRFFHGYCDYRHGVYNGMARDIEGLDVFIDVDSMKVVRVVDVGDTPIPTGNHDFTPEALGATRAVPGPISVSQPLGPGFERTGNVIDWQKWSFHVRVDTRVGPVLSRVRYADGGRVRSVLYQASLSEMFVPYQDSTLGWYDRNWLDLGDFHIGGLAEPLLRGIDCPSHAVYFETAVVTEKGTPRRRKDVACLFEREPGDPAWRHGSEEDQPIASRPRRELVLRSIAVVGNYDYIFDWIFQQDGSIRVSVGASGMMAVKNTRARGAGEVVAAGRDGLSRVAAGETGKVEVKGARTSGAGSVEAEDRFGRFVDEHVVAVNHDHYFSFRLDFDVDGPENSLVMDRLQTERLPESHPRRSAWTVTSVAASTESEGKRNMDMMRPELWRIVNPSQKGRLGYPTSYQIVPEHNAMVLLSPDDWPRRRAGFIDHHLWITPLAPRERFAAGDYTVLSPAGQGLPQWTKDNRRIENTDIVAWYTLGFHHVPRAEDWPVMPVAWHGFTIRPFDFFDRNPALDLPGH